MFFDDQSGGVRMSGRSENITGSIFRAGSLYAIKAAVQKSEYGEPLPAYFLAGLAKCLDIEEKKAIDIVKGMVASMARGLLLEVQCLFKSVALSCPILYLSSSARC